jgi:hypothetical protein
MELNEYLTRATVERAHDDFNALVKAASLPTKPLVSNKRLAEMLPGLIKRFITPEELAQTSADEVAEGLRLTDEAAGELGPELANAIRASFERLGKTKTALAEPGRLSALWSSLPEPTRRAIIAGAIGGGLTAPVAGVSQYMASRPMQSGESVNEIAARSLRRKLQEMNEARGDEPGYMPDLAQEYARSSENLAAVDRRHPAASALLAALIGGTGGAGIGALSSLVR